VNVLLKGIVGSTAYGLDHEGSDVDFLGIYGESTSVLLGLNKPVDSVVTKDPDTTMHEAKKFASLCLNGNPSVSELLWLDSYEHVSEEGAALLELRSSFLSARRVRDSYLGYADSQFGRLRNRGDGSFSSDTRKRTEKHARHLVRLVEQGFHLYVQGHLVVNLRSEASETDPEWVFKMGRDIAADPSLAEQYMVRAGVRFDGATSVLPDRPDVDSVEKWLIRVRRANWGLGWSG
jgi:hypothetical protein